MADAVGAAIAGTNLAIETGKFLHKAHHSHEVVSDITYTIETLKREVLQAILSLRKHRGVSKDVLLSQIKPLTNALKYSKWKGNLAHVKQVNASLPDDTTVLLDRIAHLVSELHPPFHDKTSKDDEDKLSWRSKLTIQFTKDTWGAVITILENTKQALGHESAGAVNRISIGTTVKRMLDSTSSSEDPGVLILDRAGYTPREFAAVAQDEITSVNDNNTDREIFFHGVAGCGKSTVATALYNYLQKHGSNPVAFIHTHLSGKSTQHAIYTDIARRLMNSVNTNTVSPETLPMWDKSSDFPPYSIPLLQKLISDCLIDNAVDMIIDEIDDLSTDTLYKFFRVMLKKHPRLRIIWFCRRKYNAPPTLPNGVKEVALHPKTTGIKSIFLRAVLVQPKLRTYEPGIVRMLQCMCGNSYRIMYATLFKLCCASSSAEIERYIPGFAQPDIDKDIARLTALARTSLLDTIVLALLSLGQSIPKTDVLRLAVDVHNYWPRVVPKVACSLWSVPCHQFQEQVQSTAARLDSFLVEENGEFGLKDPLYMGTILTLISNNYREFAEWFPTAFVQLGYLQHRVCTEIAQRVALVYPDSCTHFQALVGGSSKLAGILKETVPAAYDSNPLAYLESLAEKNPQNGRLTIPRYIDEVVRYD